MALIPGECTREGTEGNVRQLEEGVGGCTVKWIPVSEEGGTPFDTRFSDENKEGCIRGSLSTLDTAVMVSTGLGTSDRICFSSSASGSGLVGTVGPPLPLLVDWPVDTVANKV